jgi:hypothetical protein
MLNHIDDVMSVPSIGPPSKAGGGFTAAGNVSAAAAVDATGRRQTLEAGFAYCDTDICSEWAREKFTQ